MLNISCVAVPSTLLVTTMHKANKHRYIMLVALGILVLICVMLEWTAEGCETNWDINGSVVTCNCNHLTNFAILVSTSMASVYRHFKFESSYSNFSGCLLQISGLFAISCT